MKTQDNFSIDLRAKLESMLRHASMGNKCLELDAEDIAGVVIIEVFGHLWDKYQSKEMTWEHVVAVAKMRARLRWYSHVGDVRQREVALNDTEVFIDHQNELESRIQFGLDVKRLASQLDLSGKLLLEGLLCGLSIADAAAQISMPQGTARRRVAEMRAKWYRRVR